MEITAIFDYNKNYYDYTNICVCVCALQLTLQVLLYMYILQVQCYNPDLKTASITWMK